MLVVRVLSITAFLELVVVAGGVVLLRPRWLAAGLIGMWVFWLIPAWVIGDTADRGGWVFAMCAATVMALALHQLRDRALRQVGQAVADAKEEAIHDPLTGLLNRRGLRLVGGEVLAIARRSRESVGCTFIDVDGLKQANDHFGHDVGDEIILAVAEALQDVFRQADVIARWGGDEFVILGLGPGPQVDDVERRMVSQLGAAEVAAVGHWNPGVSAGRVVHMPWEEEDLEQMLERADHEMYRRRRLRRAKQAERDG
jgi:diguanylate cyclase (GGDEF)-like protein